MIPSPRTVTRCLVCGFTEIRTDEVIDRGLVLLAECPRCQHRWTAPLGGAHSPVRSAQPSRLASAGGPVDREDAHAA